MSMRRVRNTRFLAPGEIVIAKQVFENTIPYDKVLISDGLGQDDREFTLPTNLPFSVLFNVRGGKDEIHAGDGYYGMSKQFEDQKTLIHELTHVWQGEHGQTSWDYVIGSALNQIQLGNEAYRYDTSKWLEWDD